MYSLLIIYSSTYSSKKKKIYTLLTGGRRSDALIETRENDRDREEREREMIEIYAVMPGKPDGREEEVELYSFRTVLVLSNVQTTSRSY
jgi:hypothetical protein